MRRSEDRSLWCIVVADDYAPDWPIAPGGARTPVQYCALENDVTPLQRALRRAADLVPTAQMIITAFEEYRERWEPEVWFARPEQRFVCENHAASSLASAAAILSVATSSPSAVITLLPARCYVANEDVLRNSLSFSLAELPRTPEGILTLGMQESQDAIDEDYLLVSPARSWCGLQIDGLVQSPVPCVASYLKREGALVASGVLIGYAGAFAAHVSKIWPGLSTRLVQMVDAARKVGTECEIPVSLMKGVPPAVVNSLAWHPPTMPQGALPVCGAGWSGLKSLRAVARVLLDQKVARRSSRRGRQETVQTGAGLAGYRPSTGPIYNLFEVL